MSSTELVVPGFNDVEAYANALDYLGDSLPDFEGKPILKLTNKGGIVFGADKESLDPDDLLAVFPVFKEGWIAFKGNEIAETEDGDPAEIVCAIGKLPHIDDLPELVQPKNKRDDPVRWRHQIIVEMVVVDGPNKGTELIYKPTSAGGRRMLAKLAQEIVRRIRKGEADQVPVIEMWTKGYHSKNWDEERFNPHFEIVEWVNINDEELKSKEPEPSEAEAKKESPRGRSRGRSEQNSGPEDDNRSSRGENRRARNTRDEDARDEKEESPRGRSDGPRGRGRSRGR